MSGTPNARATTTLLRLAAVVLLVCATLGAGALWLWEPLSLQSLRLAQFDQFQRWQPRVYTPVSVRIVDIDEASLREFGQWPWSRARIAELVDRLQAAGAIAMAFDVLLTEPDRMAPTAMARLWPDAHLEPLLKQLPDPDAVLARSLTQRPVVLGSQLLQTPALPHAPGSNRPTTLPTSLPFRFVNTGAAAALGAATGFDAVVWPLPELSKQASGIGALNASPDHDGVVRRVPLVLRLGTAQVPGLSAEALRVAQGARNYIVRNDAFGVAELRVGSVNIPTNAQGELWLHYTAPQSGRFVSAQQVLQQQVAPELLRDHIVLIGSTAAGLMDLRLDPWGQTLPGVLAHGLALEQMALGHYLQRPPWAVALEALVLLLGTLVVGLVGLFASARWAAWALLAVLAATGGGAWYAYTGHLLLLDAVNPALAMLAVFVLASGFHHWVTERQQRWLRTAFSRYVSPNRVAHLVAHPELLHLGGKRQVCSFVFTDLMGFTPMIEGSDPQQLVGLLNDYLEAMLVIVFKHEGTLDRFVGDAMVVLFSAPTEQPEHRQQAMDCALEMDAFATAYAARLQAQGVPWGLTRIGVHSGEVIVGNFGGKTLFDYRALGDPINTAARLESANTYLGTRVCVSQATLDGCTGVAVRNIGRVLLKGKSQPIEVFTPSVALYAASCAEPADYAAAMALLAPGIDHDAQRAHSLLEALARQHPHDPLVALHLQRLRQGATDDLIVLQDK